MQGLRSYTVTYSGVLRVQAFNAQDAEAAALEVIRRDGPDDIDVVERIAENAQAEPRD